MGKLQLSDYTVFKVTPNLMEKEILDSLLFAGGKISLDTLLFMVRVDSYLSLQVIVSMHETKKA